MRIIILIVASSLFLSCNTSKKEILETHTYTNDLVNETSPYLLQHAHNPVNWQGWNDATLKQAKKEKKLMIVSIGYAACHWCHVMEHESFEDTAVAAVMNKNFIPVKVDREERPDVDQTYINAVQLMTGSAGWPLNVVTLPDGRPVWGGTYFKKNDWINALEKIQELYQDEPEKLIAYANRLEAGIKEMDLIQLNTEEVNFADFPVNDIVSFWKQNFDHTFGGFNRAPKFMMPNNYEFLMRYAYEEKDSELLEFVNLTLTKMAYGGLYDQLGGGFSRYSVDAKWHVPHFEKMLYDNGQLVSLYSNAYKLTKNPLYKEIVVETLEFISEEMTNDKNGFYSSLDADSLNDEGELEEGAYYVFTSDELKAELGEDFKLFKEYYNVNSFGKWEHNNYVLIRDKSDDEIIKDFSITSEELKTKKKDWKKKLLEYRNTRPKPRLDDKTLTSWNALMLKGYVDAYKAFQTAEYLEIAIKNATFISEYMLQENGALFHNYKDGKSNINGYLEDYALTIQAYMALYEVTQDEKWLELSNKLAAFSIENFYDEEIGMFYFTSKEDSVIVTRNIEYRDNVIPASNSVMAKNLFMLAKYYENATFAEISTQMLKNVHMEIEQYPSGYSNWLDVMANLRNDFYEVVVVGEDAKKKIREINSNYLPNIIIAGSQTESNKPLFENRFVAGETLIYVCKNNTCKLPVKETEKAINSVKNN